MLKNVILDADIRAIQPITCTDKKVRTLCLIEEADVASIKKDATCLWVESDGAAKLPATVKRPDGKLIAQFAAHELDRPIRTIEATEIKLEPSLEGELDDPEEP